MANEGAIIAVFILALIALVIALFTFWIMMLVDATKRDMDSNQRVVWILVIALLGVLGATIYYFARPKSDEHPKLKRK